MVAAAAKVGGRKAEKERAWVWLMVCRPFHCFVDVFDYVVHG